MSPRAWHLAAVHPQDPAVVVEIALPPLPNLARKYSHRRMEVTCLLSPSMEPALRDGMGGSASEIVLLHR